MDNALWSGCANDVPSMGETVDDKRYFVQPPEAFLCVCSPAHDDEQWHNRRTVSCPVPITITPQVIAEGLKSDSVSLENPNVRTLLEACAAAGIGTTGLNTKSLIKKSSGEGGRKSPSMGGKKSTSPNGAKKAPAAKGPSETSTTTTAVAPAPVGASGGGGSSSSSSSKKKTPPTATPTANGVAGGEKKAKGNGNSNGTKPAASKVLPTSPKSPAAGEGANSRGKRTPTKSVGKPGLAVPTTLFPELVRMIEQGGES